MTARQDSSRPVRLEVLVCTFGSEGLERVAHMAAPRVDGVAYTICCQNPDKDNIERQLSVLAGRDDMTVHIFNDRGLSLNRNHAFDVATAPYLLISDDDINHYPEGLKAIIETFDTNPTLDIATFRAAMPERRVFPASEHKLNRPFRFYNAISFEIAVRRDTLLSHPALRFTPLAGIGAPYLGSGEEDLFVHRAVNMGLDCRFFPIEILEHPGLTTSAHSGMKPSVIRAKGAVMRITRGNLAALVRLPVEAYRSHANFPRALYHLTCGYIYSLIHRKQL